MHVFVDGDDVYTTWQHRMTNPKDIDLRLHAYDFAKGHKTMVNRERQAFIELLRRIDQTLYASEHYDTVLLAATEETRRAPGTGAGSGS